jgi:hypothetical protein
MSLLARETGFARAWKLLLNRKQIGKRMVGLVVLEDSIPRRFFRWKRMIAKGQELELGLRSDFANVVRGVAKLVIGMVEVRTDSLVGER